MNTGAAVNKSIVGANSRSVAIWHAPESGYGEVAPYHPDEAYPEYPFPPQLIGSQNGAYRAVREALRHLYPSAAGWGTPAWNPLAGIVRPGQKVLIKPNAVMDFNMNKSEPLWAAVTHPSVLRAVIDYVFIALEGKGEIVLADAPMAASDFSKWLKHTHLKAVEDLYLRERGFRITILDLRKYRADFDWNEGLVRAGKRLEIGGDPHGYTEVDLGPRSEFAQWSPECIRRLYGSDYNTSITVRAHSDGAHRYLIARTVLTSDVVISVPKLKTHGKVGITVNLKGMVGAMGDKNYIPHCRIGPVTYGGDETPDYGAVANFLNYTRSWLLTRMLSKDSRLGDVTYHALEALRRLAWKSCRKLRWIPRRVPNRILYGAWPGNDTAWRMALDLTRCVLYADRDGRLQQEPQRRFLSIVDGICAGEGDGPLFPRARTCGLLIAGESPLWVDVVAAQLMGFSAARIPMLSEGLRRDWLSGGAKPEDVLVRSNIPQFEDMRELMTNPMMCFLPPPGWQGSIEK